MICFFPTYLDLLPLNLVYVSGKMVLPTYARGRDADYETFLSALK